MSHSAVILRAADDAERQTIIAMVLSAYRQYAEQLGEQWWKSYSHGVSEALNVAAPGQLIVAERDGSVVGSVLYYPADTTPFGYPSLRLLAVTPQARGQGIATMLLEECLTRAQQSGAEALILHTMPVMEVPRRIYEKRGFVRAPQYDFRPVENEQVQGYRIDFHTVQS